jgi:glycosyltransferase involved in cell wall biosynthesis
MENMVIQLAADASARGDDVVVASAPGPWVGRVEAAGALHFPLPATTRGARAALSAGAATAALAGCIGRLRPQVIHSHNVRATAMARLAAATALAQVGPARSVRPVLVPTLHGLAPEDYALASLILQRTAQRVITCAPSVARSLRLAGFAAERIDVIPNGAQLSPAGPERLATLHAALGLGSSPLVVGIGRLVEQKNWPVLIAAAARLRGPVVAVAGDGPLRQPLTRLAARSGGTVLFPGVVDDVAALVGLARCVVSTSRWEGIPLAVLEALSLGAPVVATAVDGIADLVPADAALLVPQNDPAAIAAAIGRVLADGDFAAQLSASALAAAPRWSIAAMLARYRRAYLAAVARAPQWAEP